VSKFSKLLKVLETARLAASALPPSRKATSLQRQIDAALGTATLISEAVAPPKSGTSSKGSLGNAEK
jgi:hypothetical protein